MKKRISIVLAVLLAFSCLALVACGNGEGSAPSADSKYIGVWKATKGVFKGEETPIEEILEGEDFILDLRADGTAIVTTDTEDTGTWTEKSNGIHIKANDTNSDFTADGDNLAVDILGAKIVFEKQ